MRLAFRAHPCGPVLSGSLAGVPTRRSGVEAWSSAADGCCVAVIEVIPELGGTPHPAFPRSIFLCSYFVATTERFYAEAAVAAVPRITACSWSPTQPALSPLVAMSKPLEDLGSGRASGKVFGHRADPLASARNAALDPLPPSVASHQVPRERAGDASCLDRVALIHELEVQMGGGRVAGASCHGSVSGGAPALRRPVRAGVRFPSRPHPRGLVPASDGNWVADLRR
jgi:hypothetical protein